MAITVTKNNAGCHVDKGVYKALITEVKEHQASPKTDYGPFLVWKFKVKDPIHDGEEVEEEVIVSGVTSLKLSDGSKLDKLLTSVGISTGEGDQVDIEGAVGKVLMITVEDNAKDDRVFSKVTDTNPAPKRKNKGAKAEEKKAEPAPAPDPEDEAPPEKDAPAGDDDDLFGDFSD